MTVATSPYQLLGEERIRALAEAFYDIMDEREDLQALRAMHADDLAPMKEKLGTYLITWMGGPPIQIERHGGMCLTGGHRPYAIGAEERDQWLRCFDAALERIDAGEDVKIMLHEPIRGVANAVMNRG